MTAREPVIMQRDNERSRVALNGHRTDDGARCTLVAVREIDGTLAIYPHGMGTFGVRLSQTDAATIVQFLQDAE